jgi:hypothetical protein
MTTVSEVNGKLARIALRLLRKTEGGEIQWEENLTNVNGFLTAFPEYAVEVVHTQSGFVLRLLSTAGGLIESADQQEIAAGVLDTTAHDLAETTYIDSDSAFGLLPDLHNAARRQARGADVAIESLLRILDQ